MFAPTPKALTRVPAAQRGIPKFKRGRYAFLDSPNASHLGRLSNSTPSKSNRTSGLPPVVDLIDSDGRDTTTIRKPKNELKDKKPDFANSHELVTLLVGKDPNAKKHVLHKEFACYYSPVFKAAFNSNFIEGQTQEYRLEESTDGATRFLTQWIYHQALNVTSLTGGENADLAKDLTSLLELWVLADKLLMPSLQNVALRKAHEVLRRIEIVSNDQLEYVYDNTASDSPLRRFMTDYCASNISDNPMAYSDYVSRLPRALLTDMLLAVSSVLTAPSCRKLNPDTDFKRYQVADM